MRLDVLNPRYLPYLVTLGFLGAGAVLGLVVATGSLVMISLVIGGVTGLVLLNALPVAMWLLLIGVLLISGPVAYFFPGLSKIAYLFSLLGVFMSGAAILYAAVGKERPRRPMPTFVMLALALAVVAGVGAFFSNGPMAEISAGAKRQFQFWGVVFLLAVVPFSTTVVKRWILFLLGVAIFQLPLALYQRVVLVPQVMGFEQPGFVPFDIIVGSFEGSMFGGGASAIMAMFQVLATIALFTAWRERLISGLKCLLLMLPVIAPLALGETKVVMILMPVVLLASFYDTIAKRPLAFLGSALVTVMLGGLLAYVYFAVQVSGEMTVAENLADTFAYNFGERGYYGTGVNRLTAVPYWFQTQTWAEPVRTLFGYGIGSAFGMDGRVLLPGHLFTARAGMHIDLLAASQILWEMGIVGALLFYGMLIGATRSAMKSLAEATSAWDRVLCRNLLGSLGASVLMSFYSSSLLVLVTHSFLFAFTLGLVAWRARHGPLAPDAQDLRRQAQAPAGRPGAAMKGRKFRHWSTPVPGFAGGFGPLETAAHMGASGHAAGSTAAPGRPARAAGAPAPGRPPWEATGGDGSRETGQRAGMSPARGARRSGAPGSATPYWSATIPSAVFSSSDPEADLPAGPMFATDDEPVESDDATRQRQSRRDALRRPGRIDPVIDISDVEPR